MPTPLLQLIHAVVHRLDGMAEDDGFSTAELLANAAFAIVALFAIWQALQALGVDVINQIGTQLSGGL